MKHVIFAINPLYSQKQALDELLSHGLEHPYVIEEPDSTSIGGFLNHLPSSLHHVTLIEESEGVNWDLEWKTHSPYYKNGLLEIDLNQFGAQLEDSLIHLTPGPGFGDLSHPTTHLMLEWMVHHVPGKHILDIGCGSGILTLAAHKLGALSVVGIDIDPLAIEHSKNNALLNHMDSAIFPDTLPHHLNTDNLLILINMTFGEQKEVFNTYPLLQGSFLISGILESQIPSYIHSFPYPYSHIELSPKEIWTIFHISN